MCRADVIEMAHQWFGNLVTMEWWDALWLNEGDATLWEFYGTDVSNPSFEILRQFHQDYRVKIEF